MVSTDYIQTLPGLLKIVELVLCLAGFICAMIPYNGFTQDGGGWTQFVTITAVFGVIGILILYTVVTQRPAILPLLVMLFYAVYTLFLFIAGILTAVRAGQYYYYHLHVFASVVQAVPACAFFVLVAFLVFVVDALLSFQAWRSSSAATATTSTSGTVHTTSVTTTTSKSAVVVS